MLAWRLSPAHRVVSTAAFGGGLGERHWVLNARVSDGYDRLDLDRHVVELAEHCGLEGEGVAMLTAADVVSAQHRTDAGVHVVATVGLGVPTWAAAPEDATSTWAPARAAGTINVVIFLPERLSDAGLVNAATTATEAKAQALWEAGVAATGTATDAVVVACPRHGPVEPFGGPRSLWGARLARAVHGAVLAGALASGQP